MRYNRFSCIMTASSPTTFGCCSSFSKLISLTAVDGTPCRITIVNQIYDIITDLVFAFKPDLLHSHHCVGSAVSSFVNDSICSFSNFFEFGEVVEGIGVFINCPHSSNKIELNINTKRGADVRKM